MAKKLPKAVACTDNLLFRTWPVTFRSYLRPITDEEKTPILFFADSIGLRHVYFCTWVWLHQFLPCLSFFSFSRP
jgi:hypothetical protein